MWVVLLHPPAAWIFSQLGDLPDSGSEIYSNLFLPALCATEIKKEPH